MTKNLSEPTKKDAEEQKDIFPEESVENRVVKSAVGAVGVFFLEAIKVIVLAGITIGLVRYFLFKPFYVKGASMEPTYYQHEYLIIDELSYRLRPPERGEVIVFEAPVGEKDFYLKRIIGMPGERVKIQDGKIVVYNQENPQGIVLEEKYLEIDTDGAINTEVGENQYFVLGDNRGASFDSRRFGPIDADLIVGRTWLRGWPLTRLGLVETPQYDL